MSDTPHVVIIGAGFGGLRVAKRRACQPLRVTLLFHHLSRFARD